MNALPEVHLTVQMQMMQFLGGCLLGLPAGVLLEVFRTLRALLPHHAVIVFLEDTLYSFTVCFLLQCYAWMFADGVLRWYHAAGALLGLCVWLLTAGAVWAGILRRFRRTAGRIAALFAKKKPQTDFFDESP